MTDAHGAAQSPSASPQGASVEPRGINGWLILPAIGLCITPITLCIGIWQVATVVFGGSWSVLTTPGSPSFHPLYKLLLPAEIVVNVAMLGFVVLLIYLFFSKNHRVPRLMIAFYLINLVVVAVDTLVASQLPGFVWEREVIKDGARTLLTAVIWVPYFLISKRVANTFRTDAPLSPSAPATAA